MPRKRIQPGETVPLKLTATERKLVLEDVMCLDDGHEQIIRGTPAGKPVMMTLDGLDDFAGYIAAEANHCEDRKKEDKLDAVHQKIQNLLDRYTDENDNTTSIDQAKGRVAKAVTDVLAGKNPGVVSFRLPPRSRKQQAEKYPIKITALQREALLSHTRLKAAIKRRLKEAEEGTQVMQFTHKELDHIGEELGQAVVYARSPIKKRIAAVQKKVDDILNDLQLEAFGMKRPIKRRRPATKSDLLFQFKITLRDIKATIWRRFQVKDCTLNKLHEHIQTAMGWTNSHLHQFEIEGERYGPSSPDDLDFGTEMIDETGVLLSLLLPKSGKRTRWSYEYDFGDGWRHEIIFEGYRPIDKKVKYPLCLEGERACPPEDVGGPYGYQEYLEAMADPDHEQHEDFMEWSGPFDSEAFDAAKATKEMQRGLPNLWE